MEYHPIPLGSAQANDFPFGNKAKLLSQAARLGLPVPHGVILPHEMLNQVFDASPLSESGHRLQCQNSTDLIERFNLPAFRGKVAVRSAFSAEDQAAQSLAGFFQTCLNVDPTQPEALAKALGAVWNSASRLAVDLPRRDMLVMEMVPAVFAGVAFTERDFEDDLVNFTTGTAETLVSGHIEGLELTLPKLRRFERSGDLPKAHGFEPRLQYLLRTIRQTFGPYNWDIEWADDGQCCWLVQLRPVTRMTRRNEAFTIANHKEILPDLPSRLMTEVIGSCASDLFAYYRRFDPELAEHRPFIEIFRGRPLINLSLLTDMMRIWGLPTRLVTDSIGGEADTVYGFQLTRFLSKCRVFPRLGLAQLLSVSSSKKAIRRIHVLSSQPGNTFAEEIKTLQQVYVILVHEMFSLTAAMSGPLSILRRMGVLSELNIRQETVSTAMFTDLAPLQELTSRHPEWYSDLSQGQAPADAEFQARWQAYLARHGHRGIYESDIARPRYREAPAPLLMSLLQSTPATQARQPLSWVGWWVLPVWWQASGPMRAREELRSAAMKGFEQIRNRLLKLAQEKVQATQLPDTETIWMLTVDELSRLDHGWTVTPDFITTRQAEQARFAAYVFPDLFHRFDDLEQFSHSCQTGNRQLRFTGLSLTVGEVRGRAWVLTEPSVLLPEGFSPNETILVARSVDAGWIPTFRLVAGVVVETGGDLSHGSIILREIGLPAITNVRAATRLLQPNQALWLRAGEGMVEVSEATH